MADWTSRAACKDDKTDRAGSSNLKENQEFIYDYCDFCPVAQECLDNSYRTTPEGWSEDDLLYTVRGGYLPTGKAAKGPGRPPGSPNLPKEPDPDKWIPKMPPLEIREGQNMLERGICPKGLHGLESIEDLSSASGCRACHNLNRNSKVSIRIERTRCNKDLHDWIPENIRLRKRGNRKSEEVCRLCENARGRKYKQGVRATIGS